MATASLGNMTASLGPQKAPGSWVVRCVLAALTSLAAAAPARAQPSPVPTASILRTSLTGALDPGLGEAIDRLLRSELDAAGELHITGSVALDLRDVQLALGCIGETDSCLDAAAEEIGVDALVLPSVVQTGAETVLSLAVFDRHATPKMRRVTARVGGADASTGTLEAVSGLLAQLFPGAHFGRARGGGRTAVAGRSDRAPDDEGGAAGRRAHASAGLRPWPFVVAGVGGVLVGTAVAFGIASSAAQDDYAGAPTTTPSEIDAALAHLDTARTDATVSNVLFVAGGVAVLGGAAWAVIELAAAARRDSPTEHALRVVPVASRSGVGVLVGGVL